MIRRALDGTRSTKNATPAFSPRASALAAPKKLEPTISPRATSSDHSTGALNSERSSTEPMTTRRSAATSSPRPAPGAVNRGAEQPGADDYKKTRRQQHGGDGVGHMQQRAGDEPARA